jgi:hypothetical protein
MSLYLIISGYAQWVEEAEGPSDIWFKYPNDIQVVIKLEPEAIESIKKFKPAN